MGLSIEAQRGYFTFKIKLKVSNGLSLIFRYFLILKGQNQMNRIRSVDSISIFDRIFDPQIELPLQGRIILF